MESQKGQGSPDWLCNISFNALLEHESSFIKTSVLLYQFLYIIIFWEFHLKGFDCIYPSSNLPRSLCFYIYPTWCPASILLFFLLFFNPSSPICVAIYSLMLNFYWIMVSLPEAICTLKENWLSPCSCQLPIVPWVAWDFAIVTAYTRLMHKWVKPKALLLLFVLKLILQFFSSITWL